MEEQNQLSVDISEKHFESDIEASLLNNGYRKIDRSLFDAEMMLFPSVLVEFLQKSQPKEWARYLKYYGDKAEEKLARRLNDSILARGVLDVLKNGFDDMGIKLQVCYFKPDSSLNSVLEDQYRQNIIGETRQFPYSTKNANTIDMVLSINGIPVFAFELKNQFKNQDYQCAIEQWKNDRDPKELIFRFNQRFLAYFAVDLYEAWMTTELKGQNTYFMPFNQGSNGAGNSGGKGNPPNPNGYTTSYLWETVFQKDSMVDLVRRFITITEEKKEEILNGVLKKTIERKLIFPRYHQYDVVHKVLDDVKENGAGQNYLIEHSAGSGKSNSIAWIAYRLASAFDKNEDPIFDSVIIVTNRIVLDSQLQDTINSFEHKAGLLECITQKKGSRGLIEALNDKRKIIICTVQKFLFAYKDFDKISGRNFAVIIDEAHQGQSGESARTLRKSLTDMDAEMKKYAKENNIDEADIDENDQLLEEILAQGHHDNQSFFAFTATPISKTLQAFGRIGPDGQRHPFHIYSMKQAIEEGFILDVLKDYMTVHQAFQLIKDSEDNPELIEEKTKRALFKYYNGHDFTINQKVDMIMDNFLHNGRLKINGHGKAMIVCDSRHNAVKFYFAVKDYLKNHKDECIGCDALVAFSGQVKFDDDPTFYEEAKMNKDREGHFITSDKRFRQAFHSDDFNIMVVANKYQTGYDEPYLHSMYVDKKLKGVNAVQTLSRLDRVCPGKKDTFVLDFANTDKDIKESFLPFYGETTLEGDMDVNRVYDLWRKLQEFGLYTKDESDSFSAIMNAASGKKKQDATTIGKISSLLKPVVDRYDDLETDKRLLARDTMMKFERCYAFVTQLVRIADKDLFKDYLFVSHLLHLLPKTKDERIDITDKIQLEYAQLKESFHGAISLEDGGGVLKPGKGAEPVGKEKKVDTLDRIVNKVNEQYDGDFGPADKVAIDSVFKMLMDDKVVKERLKDYAKTNDVNMFIKSIFPSEFQRVLVECFMKNDDAYKRLLNNDLFQKSVMNIMAKELYKSLANEPDDGNKGGGK
jgi:type I restriction enzyme, R subunit